MPAVRLVDEKLTYIIIGLLFKVHNKLGPFYQEKYYQRAIENELLLQKIPFKREFSTSIDYQGTKIGRYQLDFVIDNKLVLETKTVNFITPKYVNQVLSYMKQLQIQIGLIANFKKERLVLKRLILPDKYLFKSVSHPF